MVVVAPIFGGNARTYECAAAHSPRPRAMSGHDILVQGAADIEQEMQWAGPYGEEHAADDD